MLKKLSLLVALLLSVTAFASAEAPDFQDVTGIWMNQETGLILLEIREDGSGAFTDTTDGMVIPVQAKESADGKFDFSIYLGDEDYPDGFYYDAETDAVYIVTFNEQHVRFDRDYCYGSPVAYVAPTLSIRYDPEAFELTTEEDGALMMTCLYSQGTHDYIHISLLKDTDMVTLLEGLALQSGQDGVEPSYGCWDFTAEEAGSVDYIRQEDGKEYDNFFMAIRCGADCYLVEAHDYITENWEDSLSDLFAETMGSIYLRPAK